MVPLGSSIQMVFSFLSLGTSVWRLLANIFRPCFSNWCTKSSQCCCITFSSKASLGKSFSSMLGDLVFSWAFLTLILDSESPDTLFSDPFISIFLGWYDSLGSLIRSFSGSFVFGAAISWEDCVAVAAGIIAPFSSVVGSVVAESLFSGGSVPFVVMVFPLKKEAGIMKSAFFFLHRK